MALDGTAIAALRARTVPRSARVTRLGWVAGAEKRYWWRIWIWPRVCVYRTKQLRGGNVVGLVKRIKFLIERFRIDVTIFTPTLSRRK